ncbi:MAG: aldo/keto reductase, partial [Clostridia bacterium]
MRRIAIANGVEMTEIVLGATKMGVQEQERERFALMDRYVEAGGNCFDSARKYANGQSDAALGRWLAQSGMRAHVVLCAKGCHPADTAAMHVSRVTPRDIVQDLDEALAAMGVEYVDMFLLHRDNPNLPVEEIMPVLDAQVKAGKVRAVGVSNWTVGRIAQANAFARENDLTPFSVSQLLFSLAQTTPAQTQDVTHVIMNNVEFGWYQETQLPVMAFGTQARGYFARYAAGKEQKPGPRQYYDFLPENHRRAERLRHLSH